MRKFLYLASKKGLVCFGASSGIFFSINSFAQSVTTSDSLNAAPAFITSGKLSQIIPVLYGEQPRQRLVQSISYIDGHKLESEPVSI